MKTAELLRVLTEPRGVSGREKCVADTALRLLSGLCDSAEKDQMGSVIGFKKGVGRHKRKIMLEAHMDQVGFLITEIEDGGLLKFAPVGGIDPRILPGLRLRIFTGDGEVPGVINVPEKVGEKAPEIKDLRIFTGLSPEQTREKIKPGDTAVYDYAVTDLKRGNFCSGAMDNRAGMAAHIMALEALKNEELYDDLYILFSTQEEVGLRGSYTGAFAVQPDLAIVVDVTHGTTVDSEKDAGVFDLGSGAVIFRGPGVDYDRALWLIDIAKRGGVKYKIEAAGGASGTTAWSIQTSGRGVPALLISIPLRYMHTNVETLKAADVEAVAELTAAAVREYCGEANDDE